MKTVLTESEKQWLGSAEEEKFFEEMMGYADPVAVAKSVVRKNQKQTAEYWEQMSVLCRRKAQLLRAKNG